MAWHARIIRLSMLSKGDDGMPHPTWFSLVCSPKAMMPCHVNIVRPCVISKGDACHVLRRSTGVLPKDHMGMQRPSSSDRACYPSTMIECQFLRRSTCIFSKGNNGMPCTISSVRVCFLRKMMEYHTRRCPIVYVVQGRR